MKKKINMTDWTVAAENERLTGYGIVNLVEVQGRSSSI